VAKQKICKGCNRVIAKPVNSLQKVHNYTCYKNWQNRIKKTKLKKIKEQIKDYKKLAWKEYSKFRRYNDPERIVNDKGQVKCYTCDTWILPSEADLGHYKHNKLDYDPINTQIQDSRCNRHLSGNLSEYRKNLARDYREEAVEDLERRASECKPLKQWQHKEIYEKYKQLNKG
jgi:hypothetical protein